jgi:hypothetical protein
MAYLGRQLTSGNYLKLDDISSQFNGSTKTFDLRSGGNLFYAGSAFSILVVLGGVIQEPESAYTIDQYQITFASAPGASDDFFCIALGVALGIGVPGEGTVTGTKLSKPFNYNNNHLTLDTVNTRVGINSSTPGYTLDINGDINFNGIFYQNGSQFVASRWTAGAGTTIYRNSSVGIGTTNPQTRLEISGVLGFTGSNIKIGNVSTGSSIAFGGQNFFAGNNAGELTTDGSYNNFLGNSAGRSNTTGYFNNFLGYFAGQSNTTGSNNNFFGDSAGLGNTIGDYNNFFGASSGWSNKTGSYNNFLGKNAGFANTSGSDNIYIGQATGNANVTGSENVIIGKGQNAPILNGSNQLVIGAGSTSWITGNSSYNVGIGTTRPTSKLQIQGDALVSGIVTATSFSGGGANLTSLTAGNLSGTIPSGVLGNSTLYVGTTAVTLNRSSSSQSLTGINIDGSSASCSGNSATATTATNQSGGTVSATTGSFSGQLQLASPSTYSAITSISIGNNYPILAPEVNAGSGGFTPIILQKTLVTGGYRQVLSMGSYRAGTNSYNGGVFIAPGGGSDNNPTDYFLLSYGGSISYSGGSIGFGAITSSDTVTLTTVPFFRNTPTIASNYTVTTTYNEMSIGPITINSGITVTVNSGATWTVV